MIRSLLRLCLWQFGALAIGIGAAFAALLGLPDAAYQRAGPFATESAIRQLRSEMLLDRPPLERFVLYWERLGSGELRSIYTHEPLREILPDKLGQSLRVLLAGLAALAALTVMWLALFGANPGVRRAAGALAGAAAAVPVFITATVLLYIGAFAGWPNWLGAGLALGLFPSILVATNVDQRLAASRSSSYHALERHYRIGNLARAGRMAREFAPVGVIVANSIAFNLVAGISIVELILGIPGAGRWMIESLLRVDLPVIFLTGVIASVSASLVLFAGNVLGLWADRRHTPRLASP